MQGVTALGRVLLWRAAMVLAMALAWLIAGPLRLLAWALHRAHGVQDAAEIEWLLAVAWRRTLAERAVRAGRCPVDGVCLGRGDCRDHACPGRGRR